MDASGDLSALIGDMRHLLTIVPTIVRTDESLYGVAQAVIRNPGARVLAVIGEQRKLVGVISVTAVIERLLLEVAAPTALYKTPTIVYGRKLARHLGVHDAKDIMQRPSSVSVSGTVREAMRLLQARSLIGLPITDEQDCVVGYVDQLELLMSQLHPYG